MSVTRRNFFRTVGLGSAGLSTSLIVGRSQDALAFACERRSREQNARISGQVIRVDR